MYPYWSSCFITHRICIPALYLQRLLISSFFHSCLKTVPFIWVGGLYPANMLEVSSSVPWHGQSWVLGVPPSLALQERWQITTRSLLPSQHRQTFFLGFCWRASSLFCASEQTELQKAGLALSVASSTWEQQARPTHWQCKPAAQPRVPTKASFVLLSPTPHTHKATHRGISCHTWLLQENTKRSRPSNLAEALDLQKSTGRHLSDTQAEAGSRPSSALWGSQPHRSASGHSGLPHGSTSAHLSPPPQPNHHPNVRVWGVATPLISAH